MERNMPRCFQEQLNASISLTDFVKDFEEEETEEDCVSDGKSKQPVIRSNLKFAAHEAKFLKNYLNNLSRYIIRRIQMSAQIQMKKKKSHKLMCNMLLLLIFFMIFITFLPKFNMGCARSTSYHGNIMKNRENEKVIK